MEDVSEHDRLVVQLGDLVTALRQFREQRRMQDGEDKTDPLARLLSARTAQGLIRSKLNEEDVARLLIREIGYRLALRGGQAMLDMWDDVRDQYGDRVASTLEHCWNGIDNWYA